MLASPVFYGVVFVLVAFINLKVMLVGPFSSTPAIVLLGLPVLLTGVAFGILGWVFVRVEGPRRPTILGHLRRCALLYATFLLSLFVLLRASYYDMIEGPHAIFFVVALSVAYAIFADALVVLIARGRYGRVGQGATE